MSLFLIRFNASTYSKITDMYHQDYYYIFKWYIYTMVLIFELYRNITGCEVDVVEKNKLHDAFVEFTCIMFSLHVSVRGVNSKSIRKILLRINW